MTKRDRRNRRTVTLAPNAEVGAPVMAGPRIRPLHLSSQPELVQAAAASPDGDAFRIVHHPSPQAEVSGWVWAEPPVGSRRGRVGLWALGCGHCGATHCVHVDATLQHLDQVLSAAPTPDTWRIAGAEAPAQLAERARRAAERHHRHRQSHDAATAAVRDGDPAVIDRMMVDALRRARARAASGRLDVPFLRESVTHGQWRDRTWEDTDNEDPYDYNEGAPTRRVDLAFHVRPPQGVSARQFAADLGNLPRAWALPDGGRLLVRYHGLHDDHDGWDTLEETCRRIADRGGRADHERGMDITLVPDSPWDYDVANTESALNATRRYDDLLARFASVNEDGPCNVPEATDDPYAVVPPDGYRDIHHAEDDNPDTGTRLFSFDSLEASTTFHTASASLDIGRIQGQVNVYLALVAASEADHRWGPETLRGTTAAGLTTDGDRLIREFATRVVTHPHHVDQLAAMYVTTDWQPPPDRP